MAFGLLAPLNLAAAAAVAVPVAIHLLQRRREATLEFPAVRFLLLAQRRAARQLRVRRLLLLALRCLAVLLFAVVLARPVVQAPGAAFREGEPGFTAVLLDTSLSMSALAADGRTRFAAAREAARAIAARGGAQERFALIEDPAAPGPRVQPRWLEREAFVRALDACAPRPLVADPGRAFAEAYRLFGETGPGQRRILAISDAARGGWDRLSLAAVPLLDPAIPVRVLRLGGDGAANRAGILSIAARGESRVAGEPREIAVDIANFGPEKVLPVEFRVDDQLVASRLEAIAPGSAARVAFSLRLAGAGAHRVEARLPPDRYPADDRRGIGVEAAAPVSVLMVDGEPGASLAQSETFFLQEALRPERLAATAPVQVVSGGSQAPAAPIVPPGAVVVLANVRAPGAAAARHLADHVAGGGSLLIFWGAACDPEAWSRELSGLLPAAVTGTEAAAPGGAWHIGAVDYAAQPLELFRPPSGGTFATASFTLRARLAAPGPAARVLARFEDGQPWLIEQPVGRGRVVLAASTADLEGNDLPTRPVFVPLVQRLVLWLSGAGLAGADDAEVVAGSPIELAGGPELAGARAIAVSPSGVRREAEFLPEGAGTRAVLPGAGEVGFYRWSRPGREGVVAVNVPPAESDLAQLAVEDLAERLRPVHAEFVDLTPGGAATDPSRLGVRSLTRPLLGALLALLLVEMAVAGPRVPIAAVLRRIRPSAA